MEEKERYELKIYAGCEYYSITDTKEKQQITIENTINLLNQQDKRIKELEQENLSLQEQSIRDNQNWIEETTQLKQQLEETKQNCNYQVMLMCSKENVLLKQQLHDLPKKIVGEIIEELCNCGKTYLENEPYIEICIVQGILNTILKKYGGEDE